MVLLLLRRATPSLLKPFGSNVQFMSILIKPLPPPRITVQSLKPQQWSPTFVCRRNLFGFRRSNETPAGVARSLANMCLRFTVYSTVFVFVVIGGFFIYDVHSHNSTSINCSHKLITREDNLKIFQFRIYVPILDGLDRIISQLRTSWLMTWIVPNEKNLLINQNWSSWEQDGLYLCFVQVGVNLLVYKSVEKDQPGRIPHCCRVADKLLSIHPSVA